MNSHEAMATAKGIAMQCKMGNLSYDEGRRRAQPYLDIVNNKIVEVSKRYGKAPYKISWLGLTR